MNKKFILLHPLNIQTKITADSKKVIMPELGFYRKSDSNKTKELIFANLYLGISNTKNFQIRVLNFMRHNQLYIRNYLNWINLV